MGSWFDPFPSVDDQEYWGVDDNSMRVSRWPQPGPRRTNAWFRFPGTFGLYPLPSRIYSALQFYLVDPPPFPPSDQEAVWWDLDPIGQNHLYFVTDPSPATGRVYTLDIKYFDVLPITGVYGEQMTQRIEESGEFYEQILEYAVGPPNRQLLWKWNQFFPDPQPSAASSSQSPGWPYVQVIPLSMGVADCFTFPSILPPPEEGFARMNGVNAYVLFNDIAPLVATRFKMEFDIRPTGADTQLVCFGYTGFGSFGYMFNDRHNFQWWNQTFFLPDGLVLDEWNHVTIEYDWSIPGASYSIWIDGILQITQGGSFVTWVWDEIGRRGSLIAGQFDLKRARLWDGTPGAPNLLVDVPLVDDACAVVPLTLKGTTFNMDLSSCP